MRGAFLAFLLKLTMMGYVVLVRRCSGDKASTCLEVGVGSFVVFFFLLLFAFMSTQKGEKDSN
jgi:hypothetical protein